MEWQRAIIKGDNSECRRALLGGRLPQQRCWGSDWSLQQEGPGREAPRHRSALILLKERQTIGPHSLGHSTSQRAFLPPTPL